MVFTVAGRQLPISYDHSFLVSFFYRTVEAIDDRLNKLGEWEEANTKSLSDEEKEYFYDSYDDELHTFYHIMPQGFYRGFLILWITFMESTIHQYFKVIYQRTIKNGNQDMKNKNRFYITLNENMIELEKFFPILKKNELWKELDLVRIIRNIVVHNKCEFEGDKYKPKKARKIYNYLNKHNIIKEFHDDLEPNKLMGTITFHKDYCKHLLVLSSKLVPQLEGLVYPDFPPLILDPEIYW